MTVIKSIYAKGFKSFAKPTEMVFGNNFNVILGPNGAGKSNVADAICFVLGKTSAKGLRAEKSANLIYNGGKTKDPAKYAEVSIVFDNSKNTFPIKEKEVKITRLVKQSGSSVYRINDEVMTRQQVVDLLSAARIDPDGHNIVLQGDIVRFMDMRPEERREIVEEVAGISVYEDKKEKAIHELESVEMKLKEANIILTERDAYLKELKKDRDQALKYKELEKNIKDNKATYIHLQIKAKEEEKNSVESKINSLNSELEKIKAKIEEYKKLREQKNEEVKSLTLELESRGEKEQLKLSKEIDELNTSIIRDESRLEVCKTEIGRIKSRAMQLRKDMEDKDTTISMLNKQKSEINKKISELTAEEKKVQDLIGKLKAKHGIDNLDFSKVDELEAKLEAKQQEFFSFQGKKQELIAKRNVLISNIKVVDDKVAQRSKSKGDVERENKLREMKAELRRVGSDISRFLDESSSLSVQLSNARQKFVSATEEMARLKARQISITERVSGDASINKVLELKKGIIGTVSSLGKVPSKYNIALEVAAGPRIKSVVVDDDATAAKCIKYLKDNKLGVVTFLPLNKLNPQPVSDVAKKLLKSPGVVGLAVDLISYDPKYKDVFLFVFGSTLVVEDIDVARKIGIGKVRMVTVEGDLIESSGAMIGGFRRSIGVFAEKDLDASISKLQDELSRLSTIVDTLEERRKENDDRIYKLRERKGILEVEIAALERTATSADVASLKEEKSNYEKEIKEIDAEIKKVDSQLKGFDSVLSSLKEQRDALRRALSDSKISSELSELEEKKQVISVKIIELRAELKNIDVQISTIHLAEKERINNILKQQEKEREGFESEITALSAAIRSKKEELKQKEALEKKYSNEFKSLFAKRNKVSDKIKDLDNLIIRESDKIKYVESRINSTSIERAKVVAELEGLNKEFEEYAGAKIRRNVSLEELKYEIKKFESLLNSMGNVNLRALEIYEEVSKQYEEIKGKVDKLAVEKEDVLKLMQEIDSKKQEIFMKTFNEIHRNFKQIFSSLSTKGEAHLELENPENVFEGGLDIMVRITDKKFLDIRSLSGGEKTLAALSFIFAIQEYNPAYFYLLDEVDAALDARNSELLSKLIQKYSSKAQYIVISHNDKVITEADQIYGVSMQDGISKVVSLKV
ncbi:MAG: chromosome segregation protein SMC [Candidatus Nanoarchaeia archaeon]